MGMRPRVQSERGPFEGHHGHHGKQGGHHGKHGHHGRTRHHRLGKVLHVLGTVAAVAHFAVHFYFVYKLKQAQVAEEKICGKKECGWRKWKCGGKKSNFQQPVVAQQPVVVESLQSSRTPSTLSHLLRRSLRTRKLASST